MRDIKITALLSVAFFLAALIVYKNVPVDPPGYCRAQQRHITNDEFLKRALKLREEDIARHGGIDAYEKEPQFSSHYPSDFAGRDFDPRNPNCCRVFLGEQVERNCGEVGSEYPVCVKLNYRTSREPIEHGDVGKLYFFDSCGNVQDPL